MCQTCGYTPCHSWCPGVLPPDIEVTPGGGMHTKLDVWCDLLPPDALLQVAAVFKKGAEKYGTDNWRQIHRYDHVNHLLAHVLEYLKHGDLVDLRHAACRALFALETDDGPEGPGRQVRGSVAQGRKET